MKVFSQIEDGKMLYDYSIIIHNSYANEPISRYYNMIADDTVQLRGKQSKSSRKNIMATFFNKDKIREIFVFVKRTPPRIVQ